MPTETVNKRKGEKMENPDEKGVQDVLVIFRLDSQCKSNKCSSTAKTTDMTGTVMNEMSTHYSLAIQRNPGSIEHKKEIWAGFYHKISTVDKPHHDNCNKWCKYLKAKAENTAFVHKPALGEE
ncbi:hypothetical protein HHI36_014277, partial [Cryptolaemus montrouzieri]